MTGGKGNGARDEVYEDEKMSGGGEVKDGIHFRKRTNLDYLANLVRVS